MYKRKEVKNQELVLNFELYDFFTDKTPKEIQSLLESYIKEFRKSNIDFIAGSLGFNIEFDYYDGVYKLFISYKRLENEGEFNTRRAKAIYDLKKELEEKKRIMKKYNLVEAK